MTSIRKFSIKSLAVWTATFIAMSCTNLDEVVKDQVERDKFGVSQGQLNTLIGPLYGGLGNYWNTLEYLNCVTDEQLAPTRAREGRGG